MSALLPLLAASCSTEFFKQVSHIRQLRHAFRGALQELHPITFTHTPNVQPVECVKIEFSRF